MPRTLSSLAAEQIAQVECAVDFVHLSECHAVQIQPAQRTALIREQATGEPV